MKKQIFYGKQTINNKDVKAITRVVKNNNLTQGKEVNLFEKNFLKNLNQNTVLLLLMGLQLYILSGSY